MNTTHRGRGRPPRRRGHEEETFFERAIAVEIPRSWVAPGEASPIHSATVKWFSPEKGFGFVALSDGSGDAFIHLNTLAQAGLAAVSAETLLKVRVGQGQKGRQITEVLSVDDVPDARAAKGTSGRGARSIQETNTLGPTPDAGVSSQEHKAQMRGTVKWYNPTKGFGFIAPSNSGKDIFVHASVLQRSGIGNLVEGQAVLINVGHGAKGPEALAVTLE